MEACEQRKLQIEILDYLTADVESIEDIDFKLAEQLIKQQNAGSNAF